MIKKLSLLFHTLRYLKPIQLYWRLYLKVSRLFQFSTEIKEAIKVKPIVLTPPIAKYESLVEGQFHFLNEVGCVILPMNWNNDKQSKLWLYNLHYFDYLNQQQIDQQLALDLMQDWISQNPVGTGNGWEPYTLSLRIVNWIKLLSKTSVQDEQLLPLYNSLFLQSRYLFKHLEYHLLGNHLFKNGVALLFAGTFFKGDEARSWLNKGKQIILEQTEEQVLADGGHFERSPMYHLLILEDILDCLSLDQSADNFSVSEKDFMQNKGSAMLNFVADILHQDGEIPFFNDTALHIAPAPESIFNYANNLGVKFSTNVDETGVIEKPDFGLFVLQNQHSKLIFDVGVIGPDYLPGHAHCDSLSYEFSLAGKRCIVNSGTYQYAGAERNSFRATNAHNTLCIDGVEQHEIWSTFRVARRAPPFNVSVHNKKTDSIECSAAISSCKKGLRETIHKRVLNFQQNQFVIVDEIEGDGLHFAESFIHLHPEVKIIKSTDSELQCQLGEADFSIKAMDELKFDVEKAWFSAEFGLKVENTVVVIRKQAISPFSLSYKVCF